MSAIQLRRIYLCACLSSLCLLGVCEFPKATNVSWESYNFKTIITWMPKPLKYSYTVEFSGVGKNRERSPHCIKTMETECDLTSYLSNLKEKYSADIISEPLKGETSDVVEFPHTRSPAFCPYTDSVIGKPDFNIGVNQAKDQITIQISDPMSGIVKNNRFLTVRDILKEDLKYRVTYRKAKSTGKREKDTDGSELVVNVDRGESYCFNVQAYIPSRTFEMQFGQMSNVKCSPDYNKTIFKDYSILVISMGILLILGIIITAVVVAVVCYRRRSKAQTQGKEGVPLRSV